MDGDLNGTKLEARNLVAHDFKPILGLAIGKIRCMIGAILFHGS